MPRSDIDVLYHFRTIIQHQNTRVKYNEYSSSGSYLFYREMQKQDSYLRILAIAISIQLKTKKYKPELLTVIDALIEQLPQKQRLQYEKIDNTFLPLPENSKEPVKIVRFKEIQVFQNDDVLILLKTQCQPLWKAVCFRIGLQDLLREETQKLTSSAAPTSQ